ncbi:MAG: PilZ domain-containing protein [bacterium]|nr:PilZ domain-containing protein [bacterium]
MFRAGDPVEVHFKVGNAPVTLRGKLAQIARPLLGIQLSDTLACNGSLVPGAAVVVAISGGTGIYTAPAVVQRCNLEARQLVVATQGSFCYQQRRQHERYRCDMQVRLRPVGDTEWTAGICRDISAGGARIYLPQELVLRSNTLELVFLSPDNQQAVRAIAEVVRTSKLLDESGWELGVRFTEMNRMEKIHFARLLQHWAAQHEREPVQPD